MRMTCISLMLASTLVTGCARTDANTPGNALAAPAATTAAAAPVATAGTVDAARPAEATPATNTWREITIPAGTQLALTLDTPVGSDTSRVEQPVTAHLARAVHIQGATALAVGSRLSGVVTAVLAYVSVYGFTTGAFQGYTRTFGNVFNPAVSMIFALKCVFFGLAVALIPIASVLYDRSRARVRTSAELQSLIRIFVVILLIEVASLVGNYY